MTLWNCLVPHVTQGVAVGMAAFNSAILVMEDDLTPARIDDTLAGDVRGLSLSVGEGECPGCILLNHCPTPMAWNNMKFHDINLSYFQTI
jgi:hypothetical protein